jgi:drug/metabolite transporter (DMT)-like permease
MTQTNHTTQSLSDTEASIVTATGSDRAAFGGAEWLLFAAVGTIWGSSYLLIKVGLDAFHPGLITFARVALGAAALHAVKRQHLTIDTGDRAKLMWLSVLWVGIPFTLFPLAEQHITSAATGLLTGATPLFTTLFGALWFNRSPQLPQKLGIGVGFTGIVLITASSSSEGSTATVGVAMVLLATVCYGIATNLASPLQHRYGSVPLMARMLTLGTIWTAPFGLIGLTRSEVATGPLVATMILGVVGTGVAFALMAGLVGRVGGPRASFITFLIPLVALALGAMLLDETVGALALAGTGLVLAATALASRSETRPDPERTPE